MKIFLGIYFADNDDGGERKVAAGCYSSLNTAQLHTCTMNADGSAVILVTMMILRFVFGVKIVPY